MTMGKQFFLCSLLLGAYGSLSRCMDKKQEQVNQENIEQEQPLEQKSTQEWTFDMLPVELQEEIISYLPIDNLYRALWLRCHEASQKFYDALVQAYLESHFVPKEFIDKAIAQDFATVCSKVANKQEFQEKIKRALECYGQNDSQLLEMHRQDFTKSCPFSEQKEAELKNLIYITQDERISKLLQYKDRRELVQVKKQLQKYLSFVSCCRDILPLTRNKAVVIQKLLDCTNWLSHADNKVVEVGLLGGSFGALLSTFLFCGIKFFAYRTDNSLLKNFIEQPESGKQQVINVCTTLLFNGLYVLTGLSKSIFEYADNKLTESYAHFLVRSRYLENLQIRIVQVLDAINQLEKSIA